MKHKIAAFTAFFLLFACLMPIQAKKKCTLRVASFNLRMNTKVDKENAWPLRKETAKDLIRFYDFDIFGTQEGFADMLDDILELGNYARIGQGRDGEDEGEHSAIIYKKDKFELLEHGEFWYSETPDHVGHGWDAKCCNRICSWGKFKEKATGRKFYFFNSHFDHQGVVARRESSRLMLERIKAVVTDDVPVFATGDYNASPKEEPIQILQNDGLLLNAYDISEQKPYGTVGTFHGFGKYPEGSSRIDHIFVTKGVRIIKYATINDKPNGKFPSDHFPIMVLAEF